jgi:hypothetical protein
MLFQLRLIRDGLHAIHSQCHAHRAIDIVTRAHEAAQLDGALERPHFDSVGFAKWHGDLDRRIAQGGGVDPEESFDSLDFALAQ